MNSSTIVLLIVGVTIAIWCRTCLEALSRISWVTIRKESFKRTGLSDLAEAWLESRDLFQSTLRFFISVSLCLSAAIAYPAVQQNLPKGSVAVHLGTTHGVPGHSCILRPDRGCSSRWIRSIESSAHACRGPNAPRTRLDSANLADHQSEGKIGEWRGRRDHTFRGGRDYPSGRTGRTQ